MKPLNRKFRAGLAALGLLGTSATTAGAQASVPPMPAASPAPAPPNAPRFAVLLLSNGRVLQGNVTEAESGDAFELHMTGGSIPVPRKDVAKRYDSYEAMYLDKAAHLPDRDPDERMKLAHWCLEQKMPGHAREQLQAVLEINPADRVAKRMLASIDANSRRSLERDSEVRAAGAEVVEPAPRVSASVPRPRTAVGRGERPVIFDLPPDAAMKRFAEFAWDVHPILQASCAGCHDEGYRGEFRLITGRSRRDWTIDVLRANLDSTLRYVRADDPTHSDLVAFATHPHGPNPRAPFHGANDRRQQRLIAWLRLLQTAGDVAPAGPVPALATSGATADGFGSDRLPPPRSSVPMAITGPPAQNFAQHYEMEAVAPGVPADARFELPSLPGAARPMPPALPDAATPMPSIPPAGTSKLPTLPPGSPVPPPDDVIPATNRSKKGAKVDPALLERFMQNRQPNQP